MRVFNNVYIVISSIFLFMLKWKQCEQQVTYGVCHIVRRYIYHHIPVCHALHWYRYVRTDLHRVLILCFLPSILFLFSTLTNLNNFVKFDIFSCSLTTATATETATMEVYRQTYTRSCTCTHLNIVWRVTKNRGIMVGSLLSICYPVTCLYLDSTVRHSLIQILYQSGGNGKSERERERNKRFFLVLFSKIKLPICSSEWAMRIPVI